jgi:glycosyltransferase involved in cell wall biosynthesis
MAQMERQRFDQTGQRLLHFDFAGLFFDDTEKDFFFCYIKENQLENVVTFHGTAYGEKKKALLHDSSFFVLLSDNEGQPISILEAMGNGLIIVTTDIGGIPDVVKDGKNGMVIGHNDPQRALKAYDYILTCNDQEIGVTNWKEASEKYTEKAYLKNMRDIFCEVC